MDVREVLKTELWSKRTTRKFLVWFGIVFGTLILVCGIWYAIETYWLTSGERNTGRVALAEIDNLQKMDSASDGDFYAKANEVEGKIEIARKKALTTSDKNVAFSLSAFLFIIKADRDNLVMRERMRQRHDPHLDKMIESEKDQDQLNRNSRKMESAILHRLLD